MNFSQQLKKYRKINGLSQEALAEKIYVTRQTISKWENDKSYPDIHNLIALSLLFDLSLDVLVKGDVVTMKETISKSHWHFWFWNILIFCFLTPLSFGPTFRLWGLYGLIVPLLFALWLMIAGFKLEQIQKKKHLKTYSQILSFLEKSEPPSESIVQKELTQIATIKWLVIIFVPLLFLLLLSLSFFIFNL